MNNQQKVGFGEWFRTCRSPRLQTVSNQTADLLVSCFPLLLSNEADPEEISQIPVRILAQRNQYPQLTSEEYLDLLNLAVLYREYVRESGSEEAFSSVPSENLPSDSDSHNNSTGLSEPIICNDADSESEPDSGMLSQIPYCTEKQHRTDSLTVALYLSRGNRQALNHLGYSNWNEAFLELGRILRQKPMTIKNMRDSFDPFYDNGRRGWYQRPPRPSRQTVMDHYNPLPFSILEEDVDEILNRYKNRLSD